MSGTPRIASPGTPPLLWSSVEEAFRNINQNFNELYATIQADGSTQVVNFSELNDDVSPAVSGVYELGDFTKAWKKLNLTSYNEIPGNELNGLWLGQAHVRDDGTAAVLPPASRVGSDLIIDPAKTFWKTLSIDSENFVEAADFADTLNINSGTAIQIVVDSSAESLTFNNTGVTSVINGSGISLSSSTGNVTITNTGVLSLTNGSSLPSGLSAGSGISVSSGTGNISITNTGVLDVQNGFGITVSRDNATGIVTVSNSAPAQVAYRTVRVAGSSDLVADSTADILVVEAGYGMVITTSEIVDDTLVIAVDQNIDITGSVFANDSSIIIDSIDQKVYANGGFTGDLVGNTTGYHTGDITGSVFADNSTKLVDAVEGLIVGPVVTPSLSIDGTFNFDTTGASNQLASITIPSGGSLTIVADTSPVNFEGSNPSNVVVIEDGDITANTVFASILNTQDSSAITVVPPVNFQTTISTDQGIQLNGVDAIIRSDGNIRLVPTNSVESLGAELVIAGLDVMGEPNVIIETATGQGTIQIGGDNNNTASVTVRKSTGEVYVGGFWRFLADGGLYSGYLDSPPDSPTAGAFYVADGVTWDPSSKSGAVPYPVFYDGASYHALY